jgi:hypothetical protein
MTGAACDPPNQRGLSEVCQGARTAGHAISVERVAQSRFDACAGVGGPEPEA